MKKITGIGLSPNVQKIDVFRALTLISSPRTIVSGQKPLELETWFKKFFSISSAYSFNSGRTALYGILQSLEIGKGDEVILQAFTCVAVPSAVLLTGAKVIYADILPNTTMDPKIVYKKISKNTKAIIVQHTFGIPSHMEELLAIAKNNNILVIEDVAHAIGAIYKNKKLGTFGDVSFFSFGRDKAFSSVFGGMAITNNKNIALKLKKFQESLLYPSKAWVVQQLLHPIAFYVALPFYGVEIGKIGIMILQKLGLLSFPVSQSEKKGVLEKSFLAKMPNALADLALLQLSRIKEFNDHREELVEFYKKNLKDVSLPTISGPLLRFPIFVKNSGDLMQELKKSGYYLGNWYSNVIDPKGTDFNSVSYTQGSCPVAEKLASEAVNLPTNINTSPNDSKKIISIINNYADDTRG